MEAVLWQVLAGTRGGPNRARLLRAIDERPRNINRLAEDLDLDYKTVQHHMEVDPTAVRGGVAPDRADQGALGDGRERPVEAERSGGMSEVAVRPVSFCEGSGDYLSGGIRRKAMFRGGHR